MEKITIAVGAFMVTANSPEEAREIMGLSSSGTRVAKNDEEQYTIPMRILEPRATHKKAKRFSKSRWLPQEVEFMTNLMKTESVASISRANYLLQRHTEGGITQMGWKISQNPTSSKLTPENQAIVDQFQEWKANNK